MSSLTEIPVTEKPGLHVESKISRKLFDVLPLIVLLFISFLALVFPTQCPEASLLKALTVAKRLE